MTTNFALLAVAAAAGACGGSFAGTYALRSLSGRHALVGRSACDTCGETLGFAATTPVLSYFALGGACRSCRGRIDPAHPVAEISGALVAGAAYALVEPAPASIVTLLGMALIAASIIDLRTQRLPDILTLIVAVCAAALSALSGPSTLGMGLVAAAAAFLSMEGVRRAFLAITGRPGLGFGDVKLLAAIALWLGPATPWAVVLACAGALLFIPVLKPADGRIAFGPYIAAAGFAVGLIVQAGILP